MASKAVLSEQQLVVLQWIADGCPDGMMTGHSYKLTAIALQNRRLVTVSKRGGGWQAHVTEAGQYYLANKTYPPAGAPKRILAAPPAGGSPRPRSGDVRQRADTDSAAQTARLEVRAAGPQRLAEQLVKDVVAAGGLLRVSRAAEPEGYHERLIRIANRNAAAPAGHQLTITALHWPHLEIRLEAIPAAAAPQQVPIPERVSRYHAAVAAFRDQKERHELSPPLVTRALKVLQALAIEAERRGHRVSAVGNPTNEYGQDRWTGPNHGHMKITVGDHTHALRILEPGLPSRAHWERTHWHDRERYPDHGSGTLAIHMCGYGGNGRTARWADGKKRRLEDRLAEILHEVEVRAAEDENRRLERERQEAERRQRWAAAIEQAKIGLVEASRAKHLDRQLDDWIRYGHLRDFLAAMRRTIEQTVAEADRPAAEEWLVWAEGRAAQLDPLARRLAMPKPPEPQPDALRPFLRGWSPYGPSGY